MKKCQQCGKELPYAKNKKFCDECFHQRRLLTYKKYAAKVKADPVRYAKKLKVKRESKARITLREKLSQVIEITSKRNHAKVKITDTHYCMACGRKFKPSFKGEKYCSRECYSQSPLRRLFLEHVNQKFGMDLDFNFFYD